MATKAQQGTPAMREALDHHAVTASAARRERLIEMMQAIREQVTDERAGHGGFVQAMVDQDYRLAFIRADGTNRTFFGALIYYREIGIPNNPRETRVTAVDDGGHPREFATDAAEDTDG